MKMDKAISKPAGLVFDVLHDIRKAMRTLRHAEKMITAHARAEKRRLKLSGEWQEAKRIQEEATAKPEAPAARQERKRVSKTLNSFVAGLLKGPR